jgi:hypothetical protein
MHHEFQSPTLKCRGKCPDVPRVVRQLAAPTVLLACAASLLAAPSAAAKLQLPPGADRAPDLPADVVVAENPSLRSEAGQGTSGPLATIARARSGENGGDDRPFWATVNICDTKNSPNALGVRTSVPGNGSNEKIHTRYTAQWWSAAAQEWKTVAGSGITDWIPLGDADMTSRQAGWTFRFVQPPAGTTYVMRGVVELQWRALVQAARKSRRTRRARQLRSRRARRSQRVAVVRERTLLTKTGMKGVQGGDPPGLSKAMCLIW